MMYRLHKEGKLYVAITIIVAVVFILFLVFFPSVFTLSLVVLAGALLGLFLIFF